jgi:DNA polymerase-3 subunit delta'
VRTDARHFPLVSIVPLYGHAALKARFASVLARQALPASLLLHGPRGIGKQRLALWLAQALICASPTPDGTPCGRCQQCRFALSLSHPDVHWFFPRPRLESGATPKDVTNDFIDAITERLNASGLYAPSSGLDGIYVATVRAIVQSASVSPAMAKRKVFVIGDADQMVSQEGSDEAANALLKLLEEPPANTTIILTSSEPGGLLPTIRSRMVNVRVAPLAPHDVEAFIADPAVAQAVKRSHPRASASELVRLASGAPGALIGNDERDSVVANADRLLASALSGDRSKTLRVAMSQGASRARGRFADTLDELSALLAERARTAVARGDERGALGASRAMASVEQAKALIPNNVSPALIAATLLRHLSGDLT